MGLPLRPLFVKDSMTTFFASDGLTLVDTDFDTALSAKVVHSS